MKTLLATLLVLTSFNTFAGEECANAIRQLVATSAHYGMNIKELKTFTHQQDVISYYAASYASSPKQYIGEVLRHCSNGQEDLAEAMAKTEKWMSEFTNK